MVQEGQAPLALFTQCSNGACPSWTPQKKPSYRAPKPMSTENDEPKHEQTNTDEGKQTHTPSHAYTTASKHAKSAARFLGLNKKASVAAALCASILLVLVIIGVTNATAPKQPRTLPLDETFMQQAAESVTAAESTATSTKATCLITQLTPAALNSVDAHASAPGTFSLFSEEVAELSPEESDALAQALSGIEGNGYTVGFTLINLNNGKGIAYNLDSRVYGASSFKGPYAAYVCQHIGDNDITFPQGSAEAGAGISSSTDSLMNQMIINSDNTAFSTLRNTYDSSGFADWLTACGVDSSIMHDTHFPRYSARESALLWLHTYQYLKTETPLAQHLASLYAQTNVSFIRSGVGSADGVQTVRNKAGWCASGQRFTGLCDAGLIECSDGTTYLMSTMTNSPDGGLYTVRLANLASALFGCRSALD